jgi:hypothetical protein
MPKAFDRIFIVMFENQLVDAVLGNAFMKELAGRGAFFSQYFGVKHPSQPNYVAAIAGSPMGVVDDSKVDIDGTNLVDLLETKGVSWKAYIEDLPQDKTKQSKGLYFRKHNPFVSFNNIRNDASRLARIVEAGQLTEDIASNALPQFAWYTPNIQNDGHTPPANFEPGNPARNVDFLAGFLKGFIEPLLAKPGFTKGTLIIITFDESIPLSDNHIYTIALGGNVQPGFVVHERHDHYSLLRTVEENFDLGTLGRNDDSARPFGFLFGQDTPAFNWADHSQPAEEP